TPNQGVGDNRLLDVVAVSTSDIWAVGSYRPIDITTPWRPLVEHWDGTGWGLMPSPNQGAGDNVLYGLAAVTATHIRAVGTYPPGSSGPQALVEHWDGATWSSVLTPYFGIAYNLFFDVAAVSASDLWAVGVYPHAGHRQPLVEHWDGATWNMAAGPDQGLGEG